MAGFDNDVVYADNWDFRGTTPIVAQATSGGDLPIGTGDLSPLSEIEVGQIVAGDASVTVTYNNPNIEITAGSAMATTYNADLGSATPAASILNVFGGTGIDTSGAGNTITISSSILAVDSIGVDFSSGGGTDPVIPDAAGLIDIIGNVVTNSTNAGFPLATHSRNPNEFNIDIQVSAAVTGAPGDTNDAGICSFNDTQFTVDADGYISLVGGTDLPSIQTVTGDDAQTVGPDANGNVDWNGVTVSNATNSKPLFFNGTPGSNLMDAEIQLSAAVTGAPGDSNDAGICSFDDTQFTVDANGFVQSIGGGSGVTITTFTSNDTWTKGANTTYVQVHIWDGGSGGGSGRRGASSTNRTGGAGGSGSHCATYICLAAQLGATETVVVGAGGAGGAAVTTDNTNGNAGTAGGRSSFGSTMFTRQLPGAGGGGAVSTVGNSTAGTANLMQFVTSGNTNFGSGATNSTGAPGNAGLDSIFNILATGGGAGGGLNTSDVNTNGGDGQSQIDPRASGSATIVAGGTGGVASGGAGGNGNAGTPSGGECITGGTAGGGGASSSVGAGGSGGNGAVPGGGGGGGGASQNGNDSGAGGSGGDGLVIVIEFA